jgi:ribosomal protein S18 acetylase RimI-like enzyme
MTLSLRPITSEDQEFLFRVYASTRQEELAMVDWEAGQREAFLRMQFDAQRRYYQENYIGADLQVILLDGEPAGRLYLHRRSDEIRIVDIALLPEYRGRGVGTALLEGIMTEARQTGKPVRIHVEIFNPALRWYQGLGFRQIADRGVYWFMEWLPDQARLDHVG